MAFPNDMSKIIDGLAKLEASNSASYTATVKESARNLIRRTFVLNKAAVDGAASDTTAYTAAPMVYMYRPVRVLGAKILPQGALTAHASNNCVINVVKGDGAGAAAVTVATYTSDVAGGNLAAGVVKSMTVTSTAANARIPLGSVLGFNITKGATGVAVPVLSISVEIELEAVDAFGA